MLNIEAAILNLVSFRQNWCHDDIRGICNCDFCEFQNEDKTCALKKFINNHAKDTEKDIFI